MLHFELESAEYKDIKKIINSVKHVYSRIGKKNKLQSKVIGTGKQTIQLCIKMDERNFNINDCILRVQDALFSAVSSVKTFEIEDDNLLFAALWNSLDGKNKRISYFKRIIGLYLWDSKIQLNKSINSIINGLMDAYNLGTEKPHAEIFNNTDILNLSKMYIEHFNDLKGKFTPDYSTLYKEYMLAKDCINSLNFLPHGHR